MTINPIPFILGSGSAFWGYVMDGAHGAGWAAAAIAALVLVGTCLKERLIAGEDPGADAEPLSIPPTIYPEAWRP